MTPTTATPAADRVAEELDAVRAELVRLDGKCATLTGLAGAALAFTVTRTTTGPLPVVLPMAAAALTLAAAVEILLVAVLRPRFGPTGFNRYAAMTTPQIRATLDHPAEHDRAYDLAILSGFARAKNRRLYQAINLLAAAVALITTAMALGALT